MTLADIFLKLGKGESLDESEREYLRSQAAQIEQASSLINSWVVPGSTIPFIRNLQAENIKIPSGEITLGNGQPGNGFSGVRIAYPALTYNGETWNIAGINNDVLQVGIRASDGKFIAAGGDMVVDANGITLEAQSGHAFFINWKTDDDGTVVGKVGAFYSGGDSGIEVVGKTKTGNVPVAHLMTENAAGTFLTGVEVRGDGEMQLDLRTATGDSAGSQKVRIMANTAVTNTLAEVFAIEVNTKGTAANGFGINIPIWAENGSGVLKQIGGLRARYTDVTNGSEDSVMEALYMLNGTLTAVQIAP